MQCIPAYLHSEMARLRHKLKVTERVSWVYWHFTGSVCVSLSFGVYCDKFKAEKLLKRVYALRTEKVSNFLYELLLADFQFNYVYKISREKNPIEGKVLKKEPEEEDKVQTGQATEELKVEAEVEAKEKPEVEATRRRKTRYDEL